jgi:AcrR family transcriptional regulator
MVRQARAINTRSGIVKAAAEMFDRFGYAGTSLQDIVAHAGVTKGALYFHFSNKEELAHAVMQEQHQMWVVYADRTVNLQRPALEALIELSYGLVNRLSEHPVVRAGIRLTLEEGTFQRPLPDPYLDWIRITAQLLERAVTESDVRKSVTCSRIARVVVSSFTGLQLVSQVLDGRQSLHLQLADMWRILLPGLVPSRKLNYYLGYVTSVTRRYHPGDDDAVPQE